MESSGVNVVINCSRDVAGVLRNEIDSLPDSKSQLTQRKNLDGSTAAWIVIATLTAQTLPHVLGFIANYVGSKQVKKIKVGDIEIENPTSADIGLLREIIASRAQTKENDG